jgi:hypothetical protein
MFKRLFHVADIASRVARQLEIAAAQSTLLTQSF